MQGTTTHVRQIVDDNLDDLFDTAALLECESRSEVGSDGGNLGSNINPGCTRIWINA